MTNCAPLGKWFRQRLPKVQAELGHTIIATRLRPAPRRPRVSLQRLAEHRFLAPEIRLLELFERLEEIHKVKFRRLLGNSNGSRDEEATLHGYAPGRAVIEGSLLDLHKIVR